MLLQVLQNAKSSQHGRRVQGFEPIWFVVHRATSFIRFIDIDVRALASSARVLE